MHKILTYPDTHTVQNIYLCCTDTLALYFTVYSLKKLSANALHVCYTLVLVEDGSK